MFPSKTINNRFIYFLVQHLTTLLLRGKKIAKNIASMKLLHYLPLILLLISLSTAKKSRQNKSKPKKKPIDEHDDFGIPSEPKIGPGGMPFNKTTSCETFGKFARFNPHSVVGITWFVFYYWANSQNAQLYKFKIPNKTVSTFYYVVLTHFGV